MKHFRTLVAGLGALGGAVVIGATMHAAPQDTRDAPAEEEAFPSLTPLRGLDVAVRKVGEGDFSEATRRFAIEAYRDEDFGTLTYLSGSGAVAAMPQPANFEIRVLPFDRYYEAVRFSPIVGAAWRLDLRESKWKLIGEPKDPATGEIAPLAPGDYDVQMWTITDDAIVVMRIDQLTGRTWTMSSDASGDKWVAIGEERPAGAATRP